MRQRIVVLAALLDALLVAGAGQAEATTSEDEAWRQELYKRCNQGDAAACRQHNQLRDSLFRRCNQGDAEACRRHNAIQSGERPAFTPMVVAPPADGADSVVVPLPAEPDPVAAAAAEREFKRRQVATMSDVLVGFDIGPVFGVYGGGGLGLSLMLGKDGQYILVRARADAGTWHEDPSSPMWEVGPEMGYRGIFRNDSGWAFLLTLVGGYRHKWQQEQTQTAGSQIYTWHVPYGRLGLGFMYGRWARLNFGMEVSYEGGYGFHHNDGENPWGQNYDGDMHQGTLRYVMTF